MPIYYKLTHVDNTDFIAISPASPYISAIMPNLYQMSFSTSFLLICWVLYNFVSAYNLYKLYMFINYMTYVCIIFKYIHWSIRAAYNCFIPLAKSILLYKFLTILLEYMDLYIWYHINYMLVTLYCAIMRSIFCIYWLKFR